MKTIKKYFSYLFLIGLLGFSSGVVYWPKAPVEDNSSIVLSDLPTTLGKWTAKDLQLSDEVLSTLGAKDYLLREYMCGEKTMSLYITHFTTGSGALTHNPEKCYTASGWTFLDKKKVEVPNSKQMILESTLARGDKRQMVVYWYQDRKRILTSKSSHIWSVVSRAFTGSRMHSLVASVSTTTDESDSDGTEEGLLTFSGLVMDALGERIPS